MPTPDKLPSIILSEITGNDTLIIQDGNQTKKVSIAQLSDFLSFEGVDVAHILSIEFTETTDPSGLPGQAGAADTYTITYRNGPEGATVDTSTFVVQNGANGIAGNPGASVTGVNFTGGTILGEETTINFTGTDGFVPTPITVQAGIQGERGDKGNPGQDGEAGERGEQGVQGAFYVKAFTRSATTPDTPTDLTYTIATQTFSGADAAIWGADVPVGTEQSWEVQRLFNPISGETTITSWGVPYHAGGNGAQGETGLHGTDVTADYNTTTERLTVTETVYNPDGTTTPTTIVGNVKIVGDQGERGPAGDSVTDVQSTDGDSTTASTFFFRDENGDRLPVNGDATGVISVSPGPTGERGVDLRVAASSVDTNNNTTVLLETAEGPVGAGTPAGSFLVNGGQQGTFTAQTAQAMNDGGNSRIVVDTAGDIEFFLDEVPVHHAFNYNFAPQTFHKTGSDVTLTGLHPIGEENYFYRIIEQHSSSALITVNTPLPTAFEELDGAATGISVTIDDNLAPGTNEVRFGIISKETATSAESEEMTGVLTIRNLAALIPYYELLSANEITSTNIGDYTAHPEGLEVGTVFTFSRPTTVTPGDTWYAALGIDTVAHPIDLERSFDDGDAFPDVIGTSGNFTFYSFPISKALIQITLTA